MTKADKISHLCQMVRSNAHHCDLSMLSADYGYLTQLNDITARGGFATEKTLEAMELQRASEALRRVADEIDKARGKLIENAMETVS